MTEPTPNPDTMKFLPGQTVMSSGTANFTDAESAGISPLASRLFGLGHVTGVFLGHDFVSVSKDPEQDWSVLKPQILSAVMDHATSGLPAMNQAGETYAANPDDSELVTQIKELLETRVRPAVAQDGGDIVFHRFEDGVVFLEMHGSCSGCPSSTATLKMGIENLLKHYVPEVTEVRAVA
jgi:Fe-S cluster biogenesis protein NfuA